MHLAVCLGVPTIGIFGHSDFASYGTYPESVPFVAVTLGGDFKSTDRRDPRGLKAIKVEDVLAAFLKLQRRLNDLSS